MTGTGTGTGTGTVSVSTVASGVKWGPCASTGLTKAGAVCAMLSVPLDYSRPKGAKIQLALSMIKHKTKKYQGIMLVNPGGPGGSGLTLSVLGQYVPNGAGDSYDWIGFDPRGVGSSKPALTCDPNYFAGPRPLYEPLTPQLERTWLARSKGYAAACGKNGGALLSHMKTTDAARDMDSIRAALRQKQINYYGFSYGTYLGQVYATLFPSRVRRMVFDGVVNPKRVWYAGEPRPGRRLRAQPEDLVRVAREVRLGLPPRARPPRPSRTSSTRSGTPSPRSRRVPWGPTSGPTPTCTPATTSPPGSTWARCGPTTTPRTTRRP